MSPLVSSEMLTENPINNEFNCVIAKRPEWRFLAQQRYLKDVTRLLLRDAQISGQQTLPEWSSSEHQTQALCQCWLGLLVSQELQHPPQLTQAIFQQLYWFGQESMEQVATPWRNQSTDVQNIQNTMVRFAAELYRLQEIIGWDQAWYSCRYFLPFLNDLIPVAWLAAVNELMLLLEQHDSLLNTKVHIRPFQTSDLHSSHPLRKQAQQDLNHEQQHYILRLAQIKEAQPKLQELLQRLPISTHNLLKTLNLMTETWQCSGLLQTQDSIELGSLLYQEARRQRLRIGDHWFSVFAQINTPANSLTETTIKEVKKLMKVLFEVKHA